MNNTWKIYMLTLISFLVGTSQNVISGILDKVANSVDVSLSAAGQLTTVFALATAIGTPILMMATAKINRKIQLLIALSIVIFGTIITIALPAFTFLMIARAILGVGTGVFVVTAYDVAANLANPGRQALAMSNISLGFSSSLVFGVPIGRVVAATYDWHIIFWGIGIFTLIGIFFIAKMIPSMKGDSAVPLSQQLALLKKPKVSLALSMTLLVFLGYSILNTYITPFLQSVISLSEHSISIVLFALGIASLIGSKMGGLLADRLGTQKTLMSSMIAQFLSLGIIFLVTHSAITVIILLMIWSIAAWTFGPTQNFNLLSVAPQASGIMLSLNSTFVQLGFAIGASLGGFVVNDSSLVAISWIGALSIFVAFGIALVSQKITHRNEEKIL